MFLEAHLWFKQGMSILCENPIMGDSNSTYNFDRSLELKKCLIYLAIAKSSKLSFQVLDS